MWITRYYMPKYSPQLIIGYIFFYFNFQKSRFSGYYNEVKSLLLKIQVHLKSFLQRLFITVQLYSGNGLSNHSAACAYGLLLSLAPMLLLAALFLSFTFKASPAAITSLLADIPILKNIFDEEWLVSDFLSFSKPGVSSIISAVSIIWAGRILSLSMQRGLKIIFSGDKNRNPVVNSLVTLAIEIVLLIIIITAIFSSRMAVWIYRTFDFFSESPVLQILTSLAGIRFSMVFLLWFFSFFAYLFVPVNRPRKLSAAQGAFLCTIAYFCISLFLDFILDISRYNFLYGTLGTLIVLLVNVYFFFIFFLLGAQFAFVTDSFDALFFSQLRQIVVKNPAPKRLFSLLLHKLYFPHNGKMTRYLRHYEKDTIIFTHGDSTEDIYFLLNGEVEVLQKNGLAALDEAADVIKAGSFFGEMGRLLSEERSAIVRAKTNVSVFALPPHLFDTVLKYDTNLDRDIIEHISLRLKKTNEKSLSANL